MTLRLPSGENLAPPARIRRLRAGRSGEEERRGGEGVKTVKEEKRNAGCDYEDGEMSLHTAVQVLINFIIIIIDLHLALRTEAPVCWGGCQWTSKGKIKPRHFIT